MGLGDCSFLTVGIVLEETANIAGFNFSALSLFSIRLGLYLRSISTSLVYYADVILC